MSRTGNAIYSLLAADSTVGSICGDRIYPTIAPQRTPNPCLVYTLVYSDPHDDKGGPSDLDVERWQLSAFANTYAGAQELTEAVRTLLERYSGTVSGVVIQSIRFVGTQDLYEEEEQDKGIYHKATDYSFRIQI